MEAKLIQMYQNW